VSGVTAGCEHSSDTAQGREGFVMNSTMNSTHVMLVIAFVLAVVSTILGLA
jgi:hypothetical protein